MSEHVKAAHRPDRRRQRKRTTVEISLNLGDEAACCTRTFRLSPRMQCSDTSSVHTEIAAMFGGINFKQLSERFNESLHDLESTLVHAANVPAGPPGSQPTSPARPQAHRANASPGPSGSPVSSRSRGPPNVDTESASQIVTSPSGTPLSPTALAQASASASQLADSALNSLRASLRKGRQSLESAAASSRTSLDGSARSPLKDPLSPGSKSAQAQGKGPIKEEEMTEYKPAAAERGDDGGSGAEGERAETTAAGEQEEPSGLSTGKPMSKALRDLRAREGAETPMEGPRANIFALGTPSISSLPGTPGLKLPVTPGLNENSLVENETAQPDTSASSEPAAQPPPAPSTEPPSLPEASEPSAVPTTRVEAATDAGQAKPPAETPADDGEEWGMGDIAVVELEAEPQQAAAAKDGAPSTDAEASVAAEEPSPPRQADLTGPPPPDASAPPPPPADEVPTPATAEIEAEDAQANSSPSQEAVAPTTVSDESIPPLAPAQPPLVDAPRAIEAAEDAIDTPVAADTAVVEIPAPSEQSTAISTETAPEVGETSNVLEAEADVPPIPSSAVAQDDAGEISQIDTDEPAIQAVEVDAPPATTAEPTPAAPTEETTDVVPATAPAPEPEVDAAVAGATQRTDAAAREEAEKPEPAETADLPLLAAEQPPAGTELLRAAEVEEPVTSASSDLAAVAEPDAESGFEAVADEGEPTNAEGVDAADRPRSDASEAQTAPDQPESEEAQPVSKAAPTASTEEAADPTSAAEPVAASPAADVREIAPAPEIAAVAKSEEPPVDGPELLTEPARPERKEPDVAVQPEKALSPTREEADLLLAAEPVPEQQEQVTTAAPLDPADAVEEAPAPEESAVQEPPAEEKPQDTVAAAASPSQEDAQLPAKAEPEAGPTSAPGAGRDAPADSEAAFASSSATLPAPASSPDAPSPSMDAPAPPASAAPDNEDDSPDPPAAAKQGKADYEPPRLSAEARSSTDEPPPVLPAELTEANPGPELSAKEEQEKISKRVRQVRCVDPADGTFR